MMVEMSHDTGNGPMPGPIGAEVRKYVTENGLDPAVIPSPVGSYQTHPPAPSPTPIATVSGSVAKEKKTASDTLAKNSTGAAKTEQPSMQPIPTVAKLQSLLPQTQWLWKGWLPRGYLTLLAGIPGVGKSGLALRIAECVLTGAVWPDGTSPKNTDRGKVAWVDTEASQALLAERCERWGLPTGKVLIPTPDGDPLTDMRLDDPLSWAALLEVMEREKPPLVVLDSLRGSYRGDENSSDLVELLSKLAALARDTGSAILIIHHLRKASSYENLSEVTLDRIRGSSAIPAMCRVVLALDTPDTERKGQVRLATIKSNLALLPSPIGMEWGDDGSIAFCEAPTPPHNETQLGRAMDIMRAFLQGHPRMANDVFEELRQAGISEATGKRANKKMGIVATKHKDGWWWSLPVRPSDEAKEGEQVEEDKEGEAADE